MTIDARAWLLTGLLTQILATPAFAADSFFPAFGNPGIDVRRYDLDLTVSTVPDQLNATAKLSIRATADLTSFSLDLHALEVSAVSVNGRSALFSQTEDKLTISLPHARQKGDVFHVVITYGGTVDPIADPTVDPAYGYVLGWLSTAGSSYVLSEPVGASTFFPANDDLKDKATFSFAVTVPEPYMAVANGRLTRVDDLGASRRYKFEMRQPMAAWLATVNVNTFTVTEARSRSGIKVRTYATPTTAPEAVEGFQAAAEMLPYFEAEFGNYPFRTYGSVAVDDPTLYYALETQSISVFPEGWYSEDVVAHELAHQWFGNSVSVENWEDLWLAEGFATYVEVLWPNRDDPAAFEAALAAIYDDVKAGAVGPAVVEAPDQLFTDRTYMRGVTVLYGLQLKIGQPELIKVLKAWATSHRYGKVTTSDFIDLVVQETQEPGLRAYLTSWIYDETVPDLPAALAEAARRGLAKAPVLVASRRGVH